VDSNSVSVGDGFKSTGGGENGKHHGLRFRHCEILVDSEDGTSFILRAGSCGRWTSAASTRHDGGKTWSKILKGSNASTGCSMIS